VHLPVEPSCTDGFANVNAGLDIHTTTSCCITILSLTLPAGSYIINAFAEALKPNSSIDVNCDLRQAGTVFAESGAFTPVANVSLTGGITLSSSGDVVLECEGDDAIVESAGITAIQVATLHIQP